MRFSRFRTAGTSAASAVLFAAALTACAAPGDGKTENTGKALLAEAFPAAVKERGTLTVGLKVPNPPLQFMDPQEQLTGIDIDLYRELGTLSGLKIEFVRLTSASLIPALQSGKIDATGVLLPSAERLAVADFVVYLKVPFGVLVPKSNPHGVQRAADLCGRRVALVQGQTPPEAVVADRSKKCVAAGKEAIKTREYPDNAAAYLSIKAGQSDAMVQSEALTGFLARTVDGGGSYASVRDDEGLGGTVNFADGFAVKKGQSELLDAIKAGLVKLHENGTYHRILDKYGVAADAVSAITINQLGPKDLAAVPAGK
ncbi:transporter substrate-binding domain-containing protein [Amycolatopsis jejuensis]|uniref:transporter substrate-binding domain-containing protein n=1 Tax=Amycolatopsis jejuensis TaxID=330084 RepID=UPI0005269EA0|nr:transporter substrate-binding domain-containing protein [Amycolatopsis jejuensis]